MEEEGGSCKIRMFILIQMADKARGTNGRQYSENIQGVAHQRCKNYRVFYSKTPTESACQYDNSLLGGSFHLDDIRINVMLPQPLTRQ